MLSLLVLPAGAQANDRWAADETEARAALPQPRDNAKVKGGVLSCEAQKWTLRLDVDEASGLSNGEAEIHVDSRTFPVKVTAEQSAVTIPMPRDAMEPLKSGLRLVIDLRDELEEAVGDVSFSLRGSRIAITAAEERCSLRDMSPYQAISFTPYSSYINLARELRKADIAAFAASTAAQPAVDAAMAEFGEGRRVLFTRLCGSSWYYGASGCNITGFAPEAAPTANEEPEKQAEPVWRVVYDTENVLIYTDPKATEGGWRDIVTLPVRGAGRIWRWDGSAYALHGELPEEVEENPLALRTGKD